ncbi:DUF6059 family protein [Micromonospora sp. CA-259024]|uniref:DUF6059 family protein n=1 Tax=Micromonospora sp. CA-259024 TaxID=3239965 RepID=UPI003D9160EB
MSCRRWWRRLRWAVWDGMVAYGRFTLGVPEILDGPSPGHPERCCPEQPLTDTERALARQLSRRYR